jgi:hypothetical protein
LPDRFREGLRSLGDVDVNQNRTVTVADLGLVNAQLAQVVTATSTPPAR